MRSTINLAGLGAAEVDLRRLTELFEELCDKWKPTKVNLDIISPILFEGISLEVIESGRQIGKSESLVALIGLWGQIVPGSQSYYLAPLLTQAKDILWSSGRIEKILPVNWIEDFRQSESRVIFTGSKNCFLKVDGCDKFDKKRGISVYKGILTLDECRDMADQVLETVKPALKIHKCPAVLCSTPPEELHPYPNDPQRDHWFIEECEAAKITPGSRYLHFITADNPHFPPEEIEKERKDLYAKGKSYVFEREYMGKRVQGNVSLEFPMLSEVKEFVFPHEELMKEIEGNQDSFEWYCMTDPASASVWAWLFFAIHKYTRTIYYLDEIYETDKAQEVPSLIWPRAETKILALNRAFDDWNLHYDEAEHWFMNIMQENYNVSFAASNKMSKSKREGFALLADIFLARQAKFSDRCKHTFWELSNYKGEKDPDHEVDLTRYGLNVSNYTQPGAEKPKDHRETQRTKAIAMQDPRIRTNASERVRDWTRSIIR